MWSGHVSQPEAPELVLAEFLKRVQSARGAGKPGAKIRQDCNAISRKKQEI